MNRCRDCKAKQDGLIRKVKTTNHLFNHVIFVYKYQNCFVPSIHAKTSESIAKLPLVLSLIAKKVIVFSVLPKTPLCYFEWLKKSMCLFLLAKTPLNDEN